MRGLPYEGMIDMENAEPKKEEISEPEIKTGIIVHEFKIELEPLRVVFELISNHVDEAHLHLTKDFWELTFVDPSHVMLGKIKIPKTIFETFSGYMKPSFKNGLDVSKLADFFRICSDFKKKYVSGRFLTTINPTRYSLELVIDGNLIRSFNCITTDGLSEAKMPEIDFPVITTINTKNLKFAMKQIDEISDYYTFLVTDNCLKLRGMNVSTDEFVRFLLKNYIEADDLCFKTLFSANYIEMATKYITSEEIKISLKEAYPIVLEFMILNEISVYLINAPRIEEEFNVPK